MYSLTDIIDSERLSVRMELWTMKEVKKLLTKYYPDSNDLLFPTIIHNVNHLYPNREITQSYEILNQNTSIGIQYEWLARFACQEGLSNLELSVVLSDTGPTRLIKDFLNHSKEKNASPLRLDEKFLGMDVFTVFKYFNFPIFHSSKVKMRNIAEENNFINLLNISWFCHKPLSKNRPCGVCKPCTVIMATGMEYRMPLGSRFRYYFRFFISISQFSKQFPRLFSQMQHIKYDIFSVTKRVGA